MEEIGSREETKQQWPGSMHRSRQDGCRGQSTRPNMVIRTLLCPTFSNGLNPCLDDSGRTIYCQQAAAMISVSLMFLHVMSNVELVPNVNKQSSTTHWHPAHTHKIAFLSRSHRWFYDLFWKNATRDASRQHGGDWTVCEHISPAHRSLRLNVCPFWESIRVLPCLYASLCSHPGLNQAVRTLIYVWSLPLGLTSGYTVIDQRCTPYTHHVTSSAPLRFNICAYDQRSGMCKYRSTQGIDASGSLPACCLCHLWFIHRFRSNGSALGKKQQCIYAVNMVLNHSNSQIDSFLPRSLLPMLSNQESAGQPRSNDAVEARK